MAFLTCLSFILTRGQEFSDSIELETRSKQRVKPKKTQSLSALLKNADTKEPPLTPSKLREKLSSAQSLDASLAKDDHQTLHQEENDDDESRAELSSGFEPPPTEEEIARLGSAKSDFMRGDTPATGKLTAPTADLNTLAEVLASEKMSENAKCARINAAVGEICSRIWLLAKQVSLLMEKYTMGKLKKTGHFGTYRVRLTMTTTCLIKINFKQTKG